MQFRAIVVSLNKSSNIHLSCNLCSTHCRNNRGQDITLCYYKVQRLNIDWAICKHHLCMMYMNSGNLNLYCNHMHHSHKLFQHRQNNTSYYLNIGHIFLLPHYKYLMLNIMVCWLNMKIILHCHTKHLDRWSQCSRCNYCIVGSQNLK